MMTMTMTTAGWTYRTCICRREECVSHVQRALEMAVSRDGASGGIIRLGVVSARGVERWSVVPGVTGAAAEAVGGGGKGRDGRREAEGGTGGGG